MAMIERRDIAEEETAGLETDKEGGAALMAGYIEEMTAEMEKLAAGAGLEALRFLLGRAREEASRAAGG